MRGVENCYRSGYGLLKKYVLMTSLITFIHFFFFFALLLLVLYRYFNYTSSRLPLFFLSARPNRLSIFSQYHIVLTLNSFCCISVPNSTQPSRIPNVRLAQCLRLWFLFSYLTPPTPSELHQTADWFTTVL